jgi:hypothetical protein
LYVLQLIFYDFIATFPVFLLGAIYTSGVNPC